MPAEEVIHMLNSDIKYMVFRDVLEKYGVLASKEVIDYVAKYMADIVYNNPYLEFDIMELAGNVLSSIIVNNVETSINPSQR